MRETNAPKHAAGQTVIPANGKPSRKRNSKARTISNILLVLGIVLLLVAGGLWGYDQWQYHETDAENTKLATYAEVSDKGSTAPVVDWAALKAVNGDVVGWVQIPGTVINYPVYQSTDNDHYLRTNAEGNYSLGGQVFMDYQNKAPGLLDQQTIIYGHHLMNGSMFKQIADMDQQEFFDSIQTVWYVTEGQTYELEPLFLYYVAADDTTVRQFDFASVEEFRSYLSSKLAIASTQNTQAAAIISSTTRVLTLATCNYIPGKGRTVLVCVEKSVATKALNPVSDTMAS